MDTPAVHLRSHWRPAFYVFLLLFLFPLRGVRAQMTQHLPKSPGEYQSSMYCKGCHSKIYEDWKKSMHSYALVDPVFQYSFEKAEQKYGSQTRPYCLSCHSPTTMVSNDYEWKNPITMEGVTCDFCHTVTDVVRGQPQNGFEVQLGDTKFGPWANIAPIGGLKFQYSQLQMDAKLCSGCHELESKNGVKVLSTYTEWQESVYPERGIQCQNCHMPETLERFVNADIRATNRFAHAHDFRGGHSQIKLEKAATLSISIARKDERLVVDAFVTNEEAGHSLPTGIPTRKVVLLLTLKDENGNRLAQQKREYQKLLLNERGERITLAEDMMWAAAGLESDNRIKPKETRHETFTFDPTDRNNRYLVEAQLNYELPVTTPEPNVMLVNMARAEKVLEPVNREGINFLIPILVLSTLSFVVLLAILLKQHLFSRGG